MSLLLLEALGALLLLLLIVWWTMFAGRPRGELPERQDENANTASSGGAAQQIGELDR